MNVFFSQNISNYGTRYNRKQQPVHLCLKINRYCSIKQRSHNSITIFIKSIISRRLPHDCKTMAKKDKDREGYS